MNKLWLVGLALLPTLSFAEDPIETLSRNDLGVSFHLPEGRDKAALQTLAQRLKTKTIAKALFTRVMTDIESPSPLVVVKGDMTLKSQTPEAVYPVVEKWIDCDDVKTRKAQAEALITELNAKQEELFSVVNEALESELTPALLAGVDRISDEIKVTWANLDMAFPESLSRKDYEIQYNWPFVMNQICQDNVLTPTSEVSELSMPGTYWKLEQGGSYAELPNVSKKTSFKAQSFHFFKKASAGEICLDTQKIQLKVKISPLQNIGCANHAVVAELYAVAGDSPELGKPSVRQPRMEPVSCGEVFKDLNAWLVDKPFRAHNTVQFEMIKNKIKNSRGADRVHQAFASYMKGPLLLKDGALVGTAGQAFSDRFDSAGQPFDPKRLDQVEFTLPASGQPQVKLLSWGNAVLPFEDAQCYRDNFGIFLTGLIPEGNGVSSVAVTLHTSRVPSFLFRPIIRPLLPLRDK